MDCIAACDWSEDLLHLVQTLNEVIGQSKVVGIDGGADSTDSRQCWISFQAEPG